MSSSGLGFKAFTKHIKSPSFLHTGSIVNYVHMTVSGQFRFEIALMTLSCNLNKDYVDHICKFNSKLTKFLPENKYCNMLNAYFLMTL